MESDQLLEGKGQPPTLEDPLALPLPSTSTSSLPLPYHGDDETSEIDFSVPVIKLENGFLEDETSTTAGEFIGESENAENTLLEGNYLDNVQTQVYGIKTDDTFNNSVGADSEGEVVARHEAQTETEGETLTLINVFSGADAVAAMGHFKMDESSAEENEDVKPFPIVQELQSQSDWRQEHNSHKRKLSHLLRTPGLNQDVVFTVGQSRERIYAHSFILWMNSNVFDEIVKSNITQRTVDEGGILFTEMIFEDVSPEVFRIVLKYMYTEEIDVTGENVYDVYTVAKKPFKMDVLAEHCVEFMKKSISFENVINIFQLANNFQEDELYQQAYSFILQNGEMILNYPEFLALSQNDMKVIIENDLLAASETTVFQAALKWANNVCLLQDQKVTPENLRQAMGEIIYKIRFPLMTAEEFKLQVVPSKILDATETIELYGFFTPPYQTVGETFPFSTTPRHPQKHLKMETNVLSLQEATAATTASNCTSSAEGDVGDNSRRRNSSRKSKTRKTITVISSDGTESEDDDWKNSSDEKDSESSSSSDPAYGPSSYSKRKRKTSRNQSNTTSKRRKVPDLKALMNTPTPNQQDKLQNSAAIPDICSYIQRLEAYDKKASVQQISGIFNIFVPPAPTQRVIVPNLNEFRLELISPPLNRRTKNYWKEFKDVAFPLFRSLNSIIFVSKMKSTDVSPTPVDLFSLQKLWGSGLKVNITLNFITILNLNDPQGNFTCCCVRNPSLLYLVTGLQLRKRALKSLTIAECDFRLFSSVPSQSLRCLRILKVVGLHGMNEFLRECTNLEEFYYDGFAFGNGVKETKDLDLDVDLKLFSYGCTLRKFVISNATLCLADPNFTPRTSVVQDPVFLFCKFSPKIMAHFPVLFPSVTEILFRNYPVLSFFEKLFDMNSIQSIGVMGARLMTTLDASYRPPTFSYTTFIDKPDIISNIRQGNIANKTGQFANHGFYMKRQGDARTSRFPEKIQWEVRETIKNPGSNTWDDEFVQKCYNLFNYSSICRNFNYYRSWFHSSY